MPDISIVSVSIRCYHRTRRTPWSICNSLPTKPSIWSLTRTMSVRRKD